MAFEQVRIMDLLPGDHVLLPAEPPFNPDHASFVIRCSKGELVLRLRTLDERTVHVDDPDLVIRVRDEMPLEEVPVRNLQVGDLVFESPFPPLADDSFHLFELASHRDRMLTLRLAIEPPSDGTYSALEDLGSEVSIEYDPAESLFRNPPADGNVPGMRFDCPKFHQISVPNRDGNVVLSAFVSHLPDGAPMPRAEFLMAIPNDCSGWFPIPILDDGERRRCLKCGSEIG